MLNTSRSLGLFARGVRNVSSRSFSTSIPVFGQALVYKKHGDPSKVVSLEDYDSGKAADGKVKVKMFHAALTLNDIWGIQGFSDPTHANGSPVIPGNEGVGIVDEPGSSSFKRGDWVVPSKPGFGTWRTEAICDADDLLRIRRDIPKEIAACLSLGPTTALRLLDDFVHLEKGDVIIQNGGTGLVAQTINQLCAMRDIKVISVLRPRGRDEYANSVERIKRDGAYIAIMEDEINTPKFQELISDLPAPKLALDCSGGVSATNLARTLGEGGTMVSYGKSSRDAVLIPTSHLIFKDIRLRTFNFENWLQKTSLEERQHILDTFAEMVHEEKIKFWIDSFDLWDYKSALAEVYLPKDRKFVLNLQQGRPE